MSCDLHSHVLSATPREHTYNAESIETPSYLRELECIHVCSTSVRQSTVIAIPSAHSPPDSPLIVIPHLYEAGLLFRRAAAAPRSHVLRWLTLHNSDDRFMAVVGYFGLLHEEGRAAAG